MDCWRYGSYSAGVDVLTNHDLIESLATRIERAYLLRRPNWRPVRSNVRVWSTTAHMLFKAQMEDPSLPLDPELFVAVQPLEWPYLEPALVFPQPEAIQHYRHLVKKLIRDLATELRGEVSRAERRIKRGVALERVLSPENASLSALGCFIVACRARRPDLVQRFLPGAQMQHQACPLYRQASHGLLPGESYPDDASTFPVASSTQTREGTVTLLN